MVSEMIKTAPGEKQLTNIVEELWTGKGKEVKAGPNISEFRFYEELCENRDFARLLLKYLNLGGYYLSKGSLWSCREGPDGCHELELHVKGTSHYSQEDYFELKVGAEFKLVDKEKKIYNLKMFPKISTEHGIMRMAAEKNPELIKELSKGFLLMYGLLQETGYIAK